MASGQSVELHFDTSGKKSGCGESSRTWMGSFHGIKNHGMISGSTQRIPVVCYRPLVCGSFLFSEAQSKDSFISSTYQVISDLVRYRDYKIFFRSLSSLSPWHVTRNYSPIQLG